jgi:hypothetical protein
MGPLSPWHGTPTGYGENRWSPDMKGGQQLIHWISSCGHHLSGPLSRGWTDGWLLSRSIMLRNMRTCANMVMNIRRRSWLLTSEKGSAPWVSNTFAAVHTKCEGAETETGKETTKNNNPWSIQCFKIVVTHITTENTNRCGYANNLLVWSDAFASVGPVSSGQ